jgi:hypothetical protein
MGDETVSIEHIKTILPYTLAHRIQWKDDYVFQKQTDTRRDPFQIHMAKEAVNDIYRRYNEQEHHIKNALAVGYQVYEGNTMEPVEGDHPIYDEIRRDMEEL